MLRAVDFILGGKKKKNKNKNGNYNNGIRYNHGIKAMKLILFIVKYNNYIFYFMEDIDCRGECIIYFVRNVFVFSRTYLRENIQELRGILILSIIEKSITRYL